MQTFSTSFHKSFEGAILNQRLSKSRYLVIIERKESGEAFFYHSLFGNLHSVPSDYIGVIDLFAAPLSRSEAHLRLVDFKVPGKLIEEFLELYYLVPEGFDERSLTQHELSQRGERLQTGELINAIQLNVSEGCNLKCSYCFADRVDERATLYNLKARNDQRMMTFETAVKSVLEVTNLAKSNGGGALVIKFFGREPLLNWEVINGVIDHCESSGQDFSYHYAITTNGTLFTPEIVRKLKRVNTSIVVSLDGFSEGNALRVTHMGKETFSAVDKGLQLLKEHDIHSCVASVLSDRNFNALGDDFIDYLKERKVKQWEVKLAMQNDGLLQHSPTQYAEKLLHLYKKGKDSGIAVTGDWYDPFATLFHTTKFTTDNRVQRLAPNNCSATDHQISVEPGGGIFGCRALDRRLGSVDDLPSLFQSAAYKHLSMRTYYNVPFCHGCKLEGFCQGVCLGHSEKKFNDIYKPDNDYCEVYRKVFDLLLLNYSRD